ncbi:nitrate ABC transporter ATP-binding protein [Hylemonella gracilis str. Niagara R]|uniref:Nitrate ABC transporter ATP-binding protein n=1 Tax=Hylemonella gracilis str. Niagara R TaxID=1458275 RepID=A0A016XJ11_9BURK|nr:ABC transporter ATP-binding protein [Hylemonella gracilis]EYC51900.1 nitrate ABC transporter ATP-binding protein [Hylemonella gracilis str. Niagara R]
MNNAYLSLSQVDMTFQSRNGASNPVLRNINLDVRRGEFITLIGHSGCGKSTVLNIVAGLLRATQGGVILDGREVNSPGPDRAVVFQNHSLLPWLTVHQNVALAVEKIFRDSKTAAERKAWVLHNLEMVNMTHALHRLPSEISGGMKQRVGIARALSMEPKVLLLDEPFGALDALTRAHLQDEVIRIQGELGNTVLMITHDVDEAVLLSDRVVMMTNGPAATIGQILDVPLARPRDRIALAGDATYNHCRQEILSFLHEKQRKVESIATPRADGANDKQAVALRA